MARTFSCEMGCGWGMVPEGLTRHRKGKKANSAGEQGNARNERRKGDQKKGGCEIH